ncbi:MAG TPA: DUF4340 domain-containing protein [Thermoanaerobaculia bacterium]|nr:DUF4340 domain-containing protein [Thermoanaerobaculia bacterium]
MTSRKLIVLTALVIALFAFVFFFERKLPSTTERKQKGDLVWEIPEEQVQSVKLEKGGAVLELDRAGEKSWRLVKPDTYPADGFAASDVVSQLARLRRTSPDSAEAKPEDYGLKTPLVKATITWKDDKNPGKPSSRIVEVGIDIPGTETTAARAGGAGPVLFVSTNLALAVKKTADEFKSREVFGPNNPDNSRLDVDRGRGRLSLAKKDGAWWLKQPLSDLADNDAVEKLISSMTALKVIDFVPSPPGQGLASLGLSPPLFHVVLADAKGPGVTVDFGASKADGNSVYGRRENQVFTVASTVTEDLTREAEAFREPKLVRFDRSLVTSIEGVFPKTKYLFERKQDGWTLGGKTIVASSVDDLMSALLDLKSRSFGDEARAKALGDRQPAATVTIKVSSGEPWTIKIYPESLQAEAVVSPRSGSLVLAADAPATVEGAFQKAATPPTPAPAPVYTPTIPALPPKPSKR